MHACCTWSLLYQLPVRDRRDCIRYINNIFVKKPRPVFIIETFNWQTSESCFGVMLAIICDEHMFVVNNGVNMLSDIVRIIVEKQFVLYIDLD